METTRMIMTREEKLELCKKLGYTCNPKTGEVFNPEGKLITSRGCRNNCYIMFKLRYPGNINVKSFHYIWYCFHGKTHKNQLDHINKDKLDNRIENLRDVNNQKNTFNTNAKGYAWSKHKNKWKSSICLNGKRIHLGYFDTEVQAREAYLKAKEKYHII